MKYSLYIFYLLSSLLFIAFTSRYLVEYVFQSYRDVFFISGGIVFLFSYGLFTRGVHAILIEGNSYKRSAVKLVLAYGVLGFVVASVLFIAGKVFG